MYSEDDFIQLSALQHYVFCPRQCALIHIEQVWVENLWTAEGRVMHERAHEEKIEARAGVRIERGVPLCSKRLGISGKADVVEFHKTAGGQWGPFPIEYKRGKPKADDCDIVQLCAQAMCLEEMLGVHIAEGAVFYGRIRRRLNVIFDEELRLKTERAAKEVHEFIAKGVTPKPRKMECCSSCSLVEICMPKDMEHPLSVKKYLEKVLGEDEKTT
ncbi:MAG: CRISPR-associated protein Cas4 [Candidatus Omnitrophota bacterium]